MPMALTLVLIALGVVVLGWVAWTFNRLVRGRNGVDESRSSIDVELNRRHDLVPRLVDSVRGYAGFEQEVLERVTEARSNALSGEPVAESTLTSALRSLFAVVEAYPDLKASTNFQALQEELSTTEDRIAYARAYYNAWVTEYESLRRRFPSMLVAQLFRFSAREFFEADVASRGAVTVSLAARGG